MAARKPKKPKSNKIPQTAAEKAARANLTMAKQMGVAQTAARASAASKGAYKPVQIRAGGDMSRYNLGRYTSDPFPVIPTTGPGGYSPVNAAAAGRGTKPGPAKSPKPKPINLKQANKQQKATYDERTRQAQEAERQRKAAAKAKRDKAKAVSDGTATNAGSKGNTSKAL